MGYEHNLWCQLMIAFAVNRKKILMNVGKKIPLAQKWTNKCLACKTTETVHNVHYISSDLLFLD